MRPLEFFTAPRRGPVPAIFLGVLLLLSVCLGATVSQATPIIDQVSYSTPPTLFAYVGSMYDRAQTFTVGLTGFLTKVDMQVYTGNTPPPTNDLLFDLRTTMGGIPSEPNSGTNILFSVAIPASAVPVPVNDIVPWTSVDLGLAAIPVTAGEVLAFCLRSNEIGLDYVLVGSDTNSYSAGGLYYRILGTQSPQWANTFGVDDDLFFHTWVDTAPVPLPPTFWLLGSGLLGLGGWRRFRKS
jgi:hypothetical protein